MSCKSYVRFIKDFKDSSYWRWFLTPPTLTFSIAIAIYCQYSVGIIWFFVRLKLVTFSVYKMDYLAGYGIAVLSYVQMAVFCYTGQNTVNRVNSYDSWIDYNILQIQNQICFETIHNRTTDSQMHTMILSGIFCQQVLRRMWCIWYFACRMAIISQWDHLNK